MTKPLVLLNQARHLRKKGYSFEEIGKKFKVSKSTAFYWTKNIMLDKIAKERIRTREKIGLFSAIKTLREKRIKKLLEIRKRAKETLSNEDFDQNQKRILCSLLYWAEGAKTSKTRITFINSDPIMIAVFLKLFRSAFALDEDKFRCLIHIHEYHNEKEIRKYWSKITHIPIKQFNKSYLKLNTKKRIRINYKGTISIRYNDYQIAQEIGFIYNMSAEKILGA